MFLNYYNKFCYYIILPLKNTYTYRQPYLTQSPEYQYINIIKFVVRYPHLVGAIIRIALAHSSPFTRSDDNRKGDVLQSYQYLIFVRLLVEYVRVSIIRGLFFLFIYLF